MVEKFDASLTFLILVNLIPIVGVIFFGWSIFLVLVYYWAESLVIGIFNVAKILTSRQSIAGEISKIFLTPFFIFHYGIFMFVHLIFIFAITQEPFDFANLFNILKEVALPALSLFVSHGISFFTNFIGKKEYANISESELMFNPYKRIIVMHVTILIGGFIALGTGYPSLVIILFSALKTIIDIITHKKEHKELQQPSKK